MFILKLIVFFIFFMIIFSVVKLVLAIKSGISQNDFQNRSRQNTGRDNAPTIEIKKDDYKVD